MNDSAIDRRRFLQIGGTAGAWLSAGCGGQRPAARQKQPNIVMIMADDMGYSDLGCYGGEIATPNLDRLAGGGLRFTRYYTNNMCVPTRASLMSGCYTTKSIHPAGTISSQVVTAAEALGAAGYSTYVSGKWHLTKEDDPANLPCRRGFDEFFGTVIGAGSFWAPATLMRNNEPAEHLFQADDFYYTDAITDYAFDFMQDGLAKESPFFLYVSYTAAHWPLHADEADIEPYKGRYAPGWDELRLKRHARMKELGVVNPDWELSPRNPKVPAWEDEPHQAWQQRRMEVYAGQITRMDRGVGRLLDALEASGEADNTLVVFQIDNGGCHVEYTPDRTGPYLPAATRAGEPMIPGNVPGVMPGPEHTFQSYGYGWANVSNTPFRLYKQHDHEGGIVVPLIARWPRVIGQVGGLTDQLAHVIDLLPTFLEAAGAAYPQEFAGRKIVPADGGSLMPIFRGERREPPEALFWEWSSGRAVRRGRWKLAALKGKPWELYDIEADGTELHDLAARRPARVRELEELWNRWKEDRGFITA